MGKQDMRIGLADVHPIIGKHAAAEKARKGDRVRFRREEDWGTDAVYTVMTKGRKRSTKEQRKSTLGIRPQRNE